MAGIYGCDISKPAANVQEAIQAVYFAYLAAVKQQNGAAMSLGRTSTFLDIYAERDLRNGVFTEEQIQEFVDHFVMKPSGQVCPYPRLQQHLRRRSHLGHRKPGRYEHRWPSHGHQDELPLSAHPG